MLQVAEKDIRIKERTIKVMEDYIYMLEKCGYPSDDKELLACKKRVEKTKE
jgi:hypothetical protein